MQRIALPSQIDRVIVGGSLVAGAVLVPVLVVLIALLGADRISGPELVWWLLALIIVAAALGAVLLRNVVRAALCLVIVALGIAGMFLLLASEFLALVQVLVYGGGVTILLLFGLMLTNAQDDPVVQDGSQKPFAFGVGIALGAVIVIAMTDATWNTGTRSVVAFRALGDRLYRDFGVPFEVASLVLLVALVGAIAISRRDRDEEEVA
ncbi:MAG: NADH-quinone oxidoreductase subunit J [Dehalococcoidia bacterium]|nr:NADH-quinone oxidoreductase subunit J [Dehalococcoidia bacterium]